MANSTLRYQQCGQNICKELHHRLLHKKEAIQSQLRLSDDTKVKPTWSSVYVKDLRQD